MSFLGRYIGDKNVDNCYRGGRIGVRAGFVLDLMAGIAIAGVAGGAYAYYSLLLVVDDYYTESDGVNITIRKNPLGVVGQTLVEFKKSSDEITLVLLKPTGIAGNFYDVNKLDLDSLQWSLGNEFRHANDFRMRGYPGKIHTLSQTETGQSGVFVPGEYRQKRNHPKPEERAQGLYYFIRVPSQNLQGCLEKKTQAGAIATRENIQGLLWDPKTDQTLKLNARVEYAADVNPHTSALQARPPANCPELQRAYPDLFYNGIMSLVRQILPREIHVIDAALLSAAQAEEHQESLLRTINRLSCPAFNLYTDEITQTKWSEFYRGNQKILEEAQSDSLARNSALHNLGVYYLSQGELERAVEHLERAYEKNEPGSPSGHLFEAIKVWRRTPLSQWQDISSWRADE